MNAPRRHALLRAVLSLAVLSVCAPAAVHADWRAEVLALKPGRFPPPPSDLSARYVFGWGGIPAAAADVRLRRTAGGMWTGLVNGGTTGTARSLWRLDAEYKTRVAGAGWHSRWFELTEQYRRYRVVEKAMFRPGGARSLRENSRAVTPPNRVNFHVPGLRDMAAALLLARSQPLRNGDRMSLAVFPGEGMYLVRVKVEGREKLRWHGEMRDTIRASLEIDRIEKDYSLTPHRKFQNGTVWVSDDDIRMPLRVEVKVFIGSVFAELESLEVK